MTIKLRFIPRDWWVGFQIGFSDATIIPTALGTGAMRQRVLFIGLLPMVQIEIRIEPRLTLLQAPAVAFVSAPSLMPCGCAACQAARAAQNQNPAAPEQGAA